MSILVMLVVVGIPAIAVLGWLFFKERTSDQLHRLNAGRRSSSSVVGRGDYMDGNRRIPVALALNGSTFYYENADLQGYLERRWIHEVNYQDQLSTGQAIGDGKVLRLRCFSQNFEFVLDRVNTANWKAALPPHQVETERASA